MRVNNEMRGVRDIVARRTLNGETYQRGAGTFLMDGQPLSRRVVMETKAEDTNKYMLCGTCGVMLSLSDPSAICLKCKQVDPRSLPDETFMSRVVGDWMKHEVGIQKDREKRTVVRSNLTDDISTVTSAAETYMIAQEQFEQECKLSLSERREPSYHRLTQPVDPGFKYKKFLSGFGMQEPWEKVYSQGERLWLPSRASTTRTKHIAEDIVKIRGAPSAGKEMRQHGPQDKPYHTRREMDHRQIKVQLRRAPSQK